MQGTPKLPKILTLMMAVTVFPEMLENILHNVFLKADVLKLLQRAKCIPIYLRQSLLTEITRTSYIVPFLPDY
jgi:hypothetical protein